MDNEKIHFWLTSDQAEMVTYALGQLPYNKVAPIIDSIKSQMNSKSEASTEANTSPESLPPPENMG